MIDELKVAARIIYRQKNYDLALNLYQTLHDLAPDDLDVLAYLGRCFGRRQQWADCGMAFEQAIEISRTLGREYGWLYRDWGHILARYQHYEDAKQALQRAEERTSGDASIIATNAYIAWREGEIALAEDLFERALEINPNHTYSLKYFATMLRTTGRVDYANTLQQRLNALEDGTADELFVVDELDDEDEL